MEDQKALKAVGIYEQYFITHDIPNIKHPHNEFFRNVNEALAHCHSMIKGIKDFLSIDGMEKRAAQRIGFIEGCLATAGKVTVETLKAYNRPEEGTISEITHEPLTYEDLHDWEY